VLSREHNSIPSRSIKMRIISPLAESLLASQEGLCFMDVDI
jgi:hypothetical protein